MDMTSDLAAIHARLVDGARRDHSRSGLRSWRNRPLAGAVVACTMVGVSATAVAAGVGFGWINVGGKGVFEVASQATLPASLKDVPTAILLANDPNAEACDGNGWVASPAMMQSPHAPGTIAGCGVPTRAEREAFLTQELQSSPQEAKPYRYWYLISTASVARGEGRPGAADRMGPFYMGSPTPLTAAQLRNWQNWNVVISGVGKPPSPTAIPATQKLHVSPAPVKAAAKAEQSAASKPLCVYQVHVGKHHKVTGKVVSCASKPTPQPGPGAAAVAAP